MKIPNFNLGSPLWLLTTHMVIPRDNVLYLAHARRTNRVMPMRSSLPPTLSFQILWARVIRSAGFRLLGRT